MRFGALMWISKKKGVCVSWRNHRLPAAVILREGGKWVDEYTRLLYCAGISHDSLQTGVWERSWEAALSPGLERWQHHTVAFSHQISVILRSPWSTPSVLTDDILCRDSTCLSGHCSCQDCRKSQKPFWGLTFLSCPPRKYSEFFRSCHRACRDMMLTWHHSFSEA